MTEPSQYFKGRTVQEQMNEVIGYVDTRAAEVATTAIASDVAQVHQDMLDAGADAQAAAASAAAAAGTLANAVKKTGEASQSIAGDIAVAGNLTGGSVTVPAPVNNTDAANKKYVDDRDALDVHLAGSEAITGAKTVPLEATGTFSNQIASSNKVKNELDNYALVVRTTGAQTIGGNKVYTNPQRIETSTNDARLVCVDSAGLNVERTWLAFRSVQGGVDVTKAWINVVSKADGSSEVRLMVKNSDNTTKTVVLASGL